MLKAASLIEGSEPRGGAHLGSDQTPREEAVSAREALRAGLENKALEMIAFRLVNRLGRPRAASILGITIREIDKLVDVFELSERFTSLDPSVAITWSRELLGISKRLMTPSVVEIVVKKVNQRQITNSKDLRKLRAILPDLGARTEFLSDVGDVESSMLRLGVAPEPSRGRLVGDLRAAVNAMKRVPLSELLKLKGDPALLKKIHEAEGLLRSLHRALTS